MFLPDNIPIICNLPRDAEFADIYFLHDIHFGSELFNEQKWKALKKKIQDNELAYVCWIGDIMENAIPNSKSDMFTQKHSPARQKEWATQELFDLRHKTLSVVAGNHEHNRTTKVSGLYPLYDICMLAGVDKKYRDTIAYLDIGVGLRKNQKDEAGALFRSNSTRIKRSQKLRIFRLYRWHRFFCFWTRPHTN